MAIQRKISIDPNPQGPPNIKFNPKSLAANALDQIFWINNDSQPHWPGLKNPDGTIEKDFFMPNQIAPDGDVSPIFAPSKADEFTYVCSLHPDEQGIIKVT